jgi:DNA polymerase III epsilon subunit-like protein
MYLFFDTETTGVDIGTTGADPSRIVQIGWALTDENGNELRSQCFVVRPDSFEIPEESIRIHGITTELAISTGVEISAALDAFDEDVLGARILVAHNIHFDKGIISNEYSKIGRSPTFAEKDLYCTMRSSTDFCKIRDGKRKRYKWPSLDELHISLFGVTFESQHNALTDARACARCYFELRRKGVIFVTQPLKLEMPEIDEDQLSDDEVLFDDIYEKEEFFRGSEELWVGRIWAHFQKYRSITASPDTAARA